MGVQGVVRDNFMLFIENDLASLLIMYFSMKNKQTITLGRKCINICLQISVKLPNGKILRLHRCNLCHRVSITCSLPYSFLLYV